MKARSRLGKTARRRATPRRFRLAPARTLAALASLAFSASATADTHDAAPCRAEVGVEPAAAFVGEQILHRVQIAWRPPVERVEWLRAPFFPEHRAEPLAQVSTPRRDSAEDPAWQIQEERRALFAARAGRLEIASATLRCVIREPDGREHSLDVELPATFVEANAPPVAGRPTDFSGLIGPVEFRRSAAAEQARIGEAVTITLQLRGDGNVWVAPLGLPIADAETKTPAQRVFPASDELDQSSDGRLVTRRIVRVDLVPQRAGRLVVPAQHVDWLDPTSGVYRRSEVGALAIEVGDAPTGAGAAAPRAEAPGAPRTNAVPERGLLSLARTAFAAIVVAGLSFGTGWLFYRARPGRRGLESALAAADAARQSGDLRREAEALERAVRAALAMRSPALAGLSHPELEQRGDEDEELLAAAALLANLELDRYGSAARAPDRSAVRAWIAGAIR